MESPPHRVPTSYMPPEDVKTRAILCWRIYRLIRDHPITTGDHLRSLHERHHLAHELTPSASLFLSILSNSGQSWNEYSLSRPDFTDPVVIRNTIESRIATEQEYIDPERTSAPGLPTPPAIPRISPDDEIYVDVRHLAADRPAYL
jgi:hypothetical protein